MNFIVWKSRSDVSNGTPSTTSGVRAKLENTPHSAAIFDTAQARSAGYVSNPQYCG